MADHFQEIYRNRARDYDRMVTAEDADRALRPSLEAICPLAGTRVVEVGVGTGRLTRLLAAAGVDTIVGVDRSAAMLALAEEHLMTEHLMTEASSRGATRWQLAVADMTALPVLSSWAGLVLAGWVLGHTTEWSAGRWQEDVDRAVAEMGRVLAPGGVMVIIETLGTGSLTPAAPTPALAQYHDRLEREHGFSRSEIRTDYEFESVSEAADACGFFFGEDFAHTIRENEWSRVPEWTGIWSRKT